MAFSRPTTDPAFFGFSPRHWKVIGDFAKSRDYVLCFRAGKARAVEWIDRGFPAKPRAFSTCKVDAKLGLLRAVKPMEREEAWRAGYAVLKSSPDRRAFVATDRAGRDALAGARFAPPEHDWATEEGLVIDPTLKLPVTSDYDLAALIDTRKSDYAATYASITGMDNRTNLIVEAASAELNRQFGTPRIMHGSQAQFSGGLANKDGDDVLVFHPDGEVDCHAGLLVTGGTRETNADLVLIDLINRYFPAEAHRFSQ